MKVKDVLLSARYTLSDTDASRWSDARLISLLNDCIKDIAKTTILFTDVLYAGINNLVVDYDIAEYAIKIHRYEFEDEPVPLRTFEEMDKIAADWQSHTGDKVKAIVYNKQNQGQFKIYPIIENSQTDNIVFTSTYGVITSITYSDEVQILIVGDGIICGQLKILVSKSGFANHFIFIGKISYDLVPKYINASDVCVVPKKIIKSGYSPLKLYEYMACEKAVIATRTQGFEILEYYNAGLLVDPSNPSDFSNEIVMLLQNDEKRKTMGENGLKLVNEQFSWNVTAKNIVDLCRNVL